MSMLEELKKIKPNHPSLAAWVDALAHADIVSIQDITDLLEPHWVAYVNNTGSPVFRSVLESIRPMQVFGSHES